MDLEKLRARRAGAINRPSPAAPPSSDGLVDALKESIATIEAGAPRSGLAALAAEAAEVSGGTVDDRRADVNPPDGYSAANEDAMTYGTEAPAVAGREAMAEDLVSSLTDTDVVKALLENVPAAEPAPAAKRGRGRPRKPRATLAVEDTIEAELDRAGLVLREGEPVAFVPASLREPTPEEGERIAALDAAARTLQDARETLLAASVAALDAASAARNALRAQGVRFEGDPS